MVSPGELETTVDPLHELLLECFGKQMISDLQKYKTLFYELPDYDSRYDESEDNWQSTIDMLNDVVRRMNLSYPQIVHAASVMYDDTCSLEDSADVGTELLNLCCQLLPIEDDDDGASRIFLKTDDGHVSCKLVLEGEFSSWVITDPRDEERTIDDGLDLKVRIRLELSSSEHETSE